MGSTEKSKVRWSVMIRKIREGENSYEKGMSNARKGPLRSVKEREEAKKKQDRMEKEKRKGKRKNCERLLARLRKWRRT